MALINRKAALKAIDEVVPIGETGLLTQSLCHAVIKSTQAVPPVEAIQIKAISAWLAGYAAPPLYASDHVATIKNKVSIRTEAERAEAWEYHWQHLAECGLMEEENDAN